ncbi:helix-turn-helix domain-containing protein [Aromatoleum buckelii]
MAALQNYAWPGNIREMENMIERGILLAPVDGYIEVEHLFALIDEDELSSISSRGEPCFPAVSERDADDIYMSVLASGIGLDELEERLIDIALREAGGIVAQAARILKLTRPQLVYRLKRRNAEAGLEDAIE